MSDPEEPIITITNGTKSFDTFDGKFIKQPYELRTTYVDCMRHGPEEEWWEDRLVIRTDYENGVITAKTGWAYRDEDWNKPKPSCDSQHSGCLCELNYVTYFREGVRFMEIIFENNAPWRTYFYTVDGKTRTGKIRHV